MNKLEQSRSRGDMNGWGVTYDAMIKVPMWEAAARKAESPIEAFLLMALFDSWDEWMICDGLALRDVMNIETQVEWQAKFSKKKYRADIVISHGPNSWKLIVECDGHNFHEKTKEQAARDKRRDREAVASGFHVIRFTGSEIWGDPYMSACDVWTTAWNIHREAIRPFMGGSAV